MHWTPHITVATVIENNGRFLLIEEQSQGRWVFNQPAGHLEANESLQEAAIREAQEEARWKIEINGLLGIDIYQSDQNNTYLRVLFFGRAIAEDTNQAFEPGIRKTVWMSFKQMQQNAANMRSPLVINAVKKYLSGKHYPLDMIEYTLSELKLTMQAQA